MSHEFFCRDGFCYAEIQTYDFEEADNVALSRKTLLMRSTHLRRISGFLD
jgi:hypothetical protein